MPAEETCVTRIVTYSCYRDCQPSREIIAVRQIYARNNNLRRVDMDARECDVNSALTRSMKKHFLFLILIAFFSCGIFGCAVAKRVGIGLLYQRSNLPQNQVVENLSYREQAAGSAPEKQLNLFLPNGTNWPVLVFVHGGNWDSGSKDLKVGGADVYGNIGRFFALRGIGVAVINYRLQPTATWREQVQDVGEATRWVYSHISKYGGNPRSVFLMGHSAGAQLVAHVALDAQRWITNKLARESIRGVISVSGAGLDMSDEKTYELGESFYYYQARFRSDNLSDWQRKASPITYIQRGAPPFLILYGGHEKSSLKRQSEIFSQALSGKGVTNQIVVVPGQNHSRIVLTLSRADKVAGSAILEFIERKCASK